MIGAGLSLDQSPPFFSSGRFFLSAPVFIIIAGLVLIFNDITLLRSDTGIVALVHLFTLGVFSMVMFGAIQQMLPVIAGVQLPKAHLVSTIAHIFLSLGTILFASSFLVSISSWLMITAAVLLLLSFLIVLLSSLYALRKAEKPSPTIKAMSIAIVSGLITAILGAWMMQNYVSEYNSVHSSIMDIHMVMGIFGFAGILIIGVSFNIIPMFYVAPEFNKLTKKWMAFLIIVGIVILIFSTLYAPSFKWLAILILTILFSIFASTIISKMNKRRRPISDITVWYWRVAGVSLFLGMSVLMLNTVVQTDLDVYVAALIGGGFILSIITGMLYKIVPFLVWFHLNAKGHFEIPTMREMLNAKLAKLQFTFHLLSLVFIMLGVLFPLAIKIAGLFFLLSGLLIMFNLWSAVKVYNKMKDVEVPNMMAGFMEINSDATDAKTS